MCFKSLLQCLVGILHLVNIFFPITPFISLPLLTSSFYFIKKKEKKTLASAIKPDADSWLAQLLTSLYHLLHFKRDLVGWLFVGFYLNSLELNIRIIYTKIFWCCFERTWKIWQLCSRSLTETDHLEISSHCPSSPPKPGHELSG